MKGLTIVLFSLFAICGSANNKPPIKIDGDVYIYEYAIKKPKQAYIRFVIVKKDFISKDICFTVNFSKNMITNVTRTENLKSDKLTFSSTKKGDILIGNNELLCLNSEHFVNGKRLIPDYVYQMISDRFFEIPNCKRLNILYNLSER